MIKKIFNTKSFKKNVWVLYYLFLFFFLLNNSLSYLDADFGWHLKVGQEISESKSVPHLEHFQFTLEGERWVDHEWLFNYITYVIYENFGNVAVNIFFVLIVLLTLIILNNYVQKYFLKDGQKGVFFIITFQLLGVYAMRPHLGVRMQEIGILNLLLLLIIIHYFSLNKKNTKFLYILPLFFYYWACIHGSFLIGLFIMFCWIGFKILEKIIHKEKLSIYNFKNIIIFSCFVFLSFLSTLVTPYGTELYSFLGGYSNTFYLSHIAEWLPFFNLPIQYFQLFYSAILVTVLLLIFGSICRKIEKNYWLICLNILFFCLFLKSRRHFPLFFIVSFPLIIQFCVNYLKLPKKYSQIIKNSLIIKFYLIISFLLVISYQIISTNFVSNPFLHFKDKYPVNAVEFIHSNSEYLNKRVFSRYGWGGYLIKTLPENKLFIDGRLPQYTYNEHTTLEEYFEFFKKGQARRKLNEHKIELVLIRAKEKEYKLNWFEKYIFGFNEEKINNKQNYFKDYLDSSLEWRIIYNDEVSIIYVRK